MLGMGGIWYAGSGSTPNTTDTQARSQTASLEQRMRVLEQTIGRLQLLNQALWELLRERAKLTDRQLEEKALEIDLRDGVQDGRMTAMAVECPVCHRVSSSRHSRCLYCDVEFEKPIMG
ncbi:MAG TPA: hypothetical protein PLO62_03040 [Candidatus Hydrogenedentes bacterium]|nr:hypothetical protein [Candidatus Hydrogenedentota bacterium]